MRRSREVRPTLSIGIAQAERGELDAASLVGRADAALYKAKQSGRDTLRVAEPGEPVRGLPQASALRDREGR